MSELYEKPEVRVDYERKVAIHHLRNKGIEVKDNVSWEELQRTFELAARERGSEIYEGAEGYYDELLRWHARPMPKAE